MFAALKGCFQLLQELQLCVLTPEDVKYAIHWVQACLILHNMIIWIEERLGRLSTMPWAQQEIRDMGREHENVVVQVPVGSPGQLFQVGLMNELFMALDMPYTMNIGQEG